VEPFFRDFAYELTLRSEHFLVRGDWAIEHGRFISTLSARSSGSGSRHEGEYSAIWRHCVDGQWRIDRYFDTTGDPVGESD
jgi:ketosteroid isomerase-like protein